MKALMMAVGALAMFLAGGLHAANRPNIIVIFTDDHGYSDLGCQGVFDDLKTPNIDASWIYWRLE